MSLGCVQAASREHGRAVARAGLGAAAGGGGRGEAGECERLCQLVGC
jgi:hypothetical protein